MFLASLAKKIGRQIVKQRAICETVMAPTAGWNARDNIADMKEDMAVIMDNWFPNSDRITTRRGSEEFASGMSGDINSLLPYEPDSGTRKLFAANGGSLYAVEAGGAVGAAVASGFGSDNWQSVNFGTSGGRFLFMCNGADTAQVYNGTSIGGTTLTGPDVTKLVWCNGHQRRLWVGETGSLSAWYGGTNAITGAFTEFPLYGVATKGGYIVGMATWTRDSGAGQDDVAIFVTSEGEAIVYSGTDPSSADTWVLQGVFQIGKPIGRRFYAKAGGDVLLLTQDGFVSAAGILVTDRSQAQKVAFSNQINKAVNDAIREAGSNFGWQPILYPRGTMLLVNIPLDAITSHQYVFNTLTKAPCRFIGMQANCWALFNEMLYFGGKDGKVYMADTGNTDDGVAIDCDVLPAFTYLKRPTINKKFSLGEAVFQSGNTVSPAFDLNVDFSVLATSAVSSTIGGTAGLWDDALWDGAVWGSDQDIYKAWKSIKGIGRAAALRTRIQNDGEQVSLLALNYIFENAGYLR